MHSKILVIISPTQNVRLDVEILSTSIPQTLDCG